MFCTELESPITRSNSSEDMPKKGFELDEDMFVLLIDSYGKAGIVQESVIVRKGRYMMAKRFFNKMIDEGIGPTRHTYNVLIWGFFLSMRLRTAVRFYEDMNVRGISPDVVTYNTMINGYYRHKRMEEAEKLFAEMKAKDIAPTVISYTTMIKGYFAVDIINDGLRLLEEMKSVGIKPNNVTYTTLLPDLCDAGKMTEAKDILKEMVRRRIAPKDNSIFLKLLNKNFCKAEEYDQAVKFVDKLIENDIILRPQSTLEMESGAYNPVIQYLCSHGQTGKAEILFRQLLKKGVEDPLAFNNLICGHAKEGTPDSAFEILKIMGRKGIPRDADAYRLLIESYLRKGEPADAKTALDSMIEDGHLPDSISIQRDCDIDFKSYDKVLDALLAAGRLSNAYSILCKIMEKGGVTSWRSYEDLIKSLKPGGKHKAG
ncbi:hypothetical protein NC653_024138 [Populus alba x Populus x berolinensis]|uniref:Pentatricopeptide repeat-containing protein n=1 Tax=Populus alba x Populus x berolinensis TaxID=444605 RepID=A0AAD6M861_9ROSI|nr:hypothetical protein NC653_024138 [Populus alba x Populus x berolinensis]